MGRADRQGDLFDDVVRFCEDSLPGNSIYGFLARERDRLFPDELFDDLFEASGRRSVPPSVVATVMVLQRLGGLSDREAVDRYAFDVRWRYAAGVGGYGAGWGSFAHTVLVDMRAGLRSGDDDGGNGKPQIDWDDRAAREELSASRARDGFAVLALLDGRELVEAVAQAASLLATVLGQDLETGSDGAFRIARRVAKDRVISTVDPDTRHGHKTSARGFDGYKGHAAVDPDSEIITATTVTAGNAGAAGGAE